MELTEVILVDVNDRQTGVMEKMEAHEKGLLHRAFSVFIFNSHGDMLLQQRALTKYHSAGLWTNACCSHPYPGEETIAAAQRRLKEELGFMVPVEKLFDFVYRADFDNGLTEHEFDHVFAGIYDAPVDFDPEEVMAYSYTPMPLIRSNMITNPQRYTAWFRLAFPKIETWWQQFFKDKQIITG